MSKKLRDRGDFANRITPCTRCGKLHARQSEARECRKEYAKPTQKEQPPAAKDSSAAFDSSSARGNKRAHAIIRMARDGHSARRIAKALGVSFDEVEQVLDRASSRVHGR